MKKNQSALSPVFGFISDIWVLARLSIRFAWVSAWVSFRLIPIFMRGERRKRLAAWRLQRRIRLHHRATTKEMRQLDALFQEKVLVAENRKVPVVVEETWIRWIPQPRLA